MSEASYIQHVKALLLSHGDKAESINKINRLDLPANADPLLALIHGDSGELEYAVSYALEHDPAKPSDEDIRKLSDELADKITEKLRRYLDDWEQQNSYHYSFSLRATYGGFTSGQGDTEYVDVTKSIPDAKTIDDAIRAAKEWEGQLLERVKFYADSATGHKRISVIPTYVIGDSQLNKVASGVLRFDDEFGISTWLNQV